MDSLSAQKSSSLTPPPIADDDEYHGVSGHRIPIWYRSPWKYLFSLKVGIILLLALTIASVVGTTIAPLARAQELIFYTWWYMALLLALALNMTCATYKTVVNKLLPTRALRIHHEKGFYHSEHQLSVHIPFQGTAEQARTAFARSGFKTRVDGLAGAARTGWVGRFGAPVSHVGLIIVLLAGFASSWLANEAIVQVPEGRTTTTMQMMTGKKDVVPLGFALTVNDFDTDFHPRTRIPSHYTSDITARDGQDRILYSGPVEVNHSPKINGWRVHQTSYQELPDLPRYEVEVSGGELGETRRVNVSPGQTLMMGGGTPYQLRMDQHMNWVISNNGERIAGGSLMGGHTGDEALSLVAMRFEPDFVLGENREITSRSQELNNPALLVKLMSNGAPIVGQWLFGREDMRGFSHSPNANYKLELLDIHRHDGEETFIVSVAHGASGAVITRAALTLGEEHPISSNHAHDHGDSHAAEGADGWEVKLNQRITAYATVLTLTRNPTIPTIYFGCVLMMIGMTMSFAFPRREVWFLLDDQKKLLHVTAKYRHHAEEFDRTTNAAIARLKTEKES
jgi:cytochrome c biogenesis protein ResB